MYIRPRTLPPGWYPDTRREIEAMLSSWSRTDKSVSEMASSAALAPHAGWYYSGRIAWSAWQSAAEADLVVIIGGHLPGSAHFLYYAVDAFDTPLGRVSAAKEIVGNIAARLGAIQDTRADNTVEVHLPMAASRFPGIPLACFRAPNGGQAAELGNLLAEYGSQHGVSMFVLGSTDLTHYGPAYGFEPGGSGSQGLSWAHHADDSIVSAFVAMDSRKALELANSQASACSVGAAIATMAFAKAQGAVSSHLLMRGSSDEMNPGADSAVGYVAIGYAQPATG